MFEVIHRIMIHFSFNAQRSQIDCQRMPKQNSNVGSSKNLVLFDFYDLVYVCNYAVTFKGKLS